MLVAQKGQDLASSPSSSPSLPLSPSTPLALQLSLLLMQNLGHGWGCPHKQWPWLGVCQETVLGLAGSFLPTPMYCRRRDLPQPYSWKPVALPRLGYRGAALGSPTPRCYAHRKSSSGGPAPTYIGRAFLISHPLPKITSSPPPSTYTHAHTHTSLTPVEKCRCV